VSSTLRRSPPTETTTRGIIVLVCVFLVLIVGIIVFSRALVREIVSANPASNTLALMLAVTLPAVLLVIAGVQFARLLRDRRNRVAGAALKLRLMAFFLLVAALTAGPLVTLAVTFINSAMGTWFSAAIGDALKAASSVTVSAWDEKVENLRAFSEGSAGSGLVATFAAAPDQGWRRLASMNRGVSALQVFGPDGAEIAFRGDEHARLRLSPTGPSGVQPREDLGDVSVLRSVSRIRAGERVLTAVFSTVASKELDRSARLITESLTIFNQVDRYRALFQYVLLGFFFLFALPILLVTVLVSLLLTERITSPIVHLEEATRRVAEGDLSFRILVRSRDELANLVDSFNVMVAELEGSRRTLVAAERISAWREIAKRLAHEIRNPLTPIKLSAQRILKKHGEGAEDFDRVLYSSVAAIIREVDGLERLLGEFGEFAKLPEPRMASTDLRELLSEVASTYAHLSGTVEIDLHEVPPGSMIAVDRGQMRRVFANLFTNAIQAMPSGGRLAVRADAVRKSHGVFCRIALSDTGAGIAEADRERIFDPYFTTKSGGTGLGLAIVRRIVFDHGGTVWVESTPGAGATFFIDLPAGGRP
jgi:two-component system nitrogen regulation sensor histidine kinase NtrY